MTERVGMVGLGQMGPAMATPLGRAAVPVMGFDSVAQARERAAATDLAVTADLAQLVAQCPSIRASLPDAAAVTAFVEGPAARLLPTMNVMSPFGGFGASGCGRASGKEALMAHNQTKCVWVETAAAPAASFGNAG